VTSLLVASWAIDEGTQIIDKARQHFTDTELWSGGAILAALLVISLIKKVIILAIVLIVLAAVAIAYQNGAFDSLIDNIQGKKTS
jgi:hypothetical protein